MPRRYSVPIASITNTATKVLVDILATAAVRPVLYDLMVSSVAAVADNSAEYQILKAASAGTTPTATITPKPLDDQDPAATATAHNGTYAADPSSSGAAFLDFALNLRATFRWVAAPGGEFISAAATTSGFLLKSNAVSGAAYIITATVHYWE